MVTNHDTDHEHQGEPDLGPDLEVMEHHGAQQLDVLAARAPQALHAAADWLAEHDQWTVTGVNISRIDNGAGGVPRPVYLLTVGLADDNTRPVHSTVAYTGRVPADQVTWHGPGIVSDEPAAAAWSAELAEAVLQHTRPSGRQFMRALVAEGGRATPARLIERSGLDPLHHAVQTLNRAARKLAGSDLLGDHGRRLILSARDPANPHHPNVHEYVLPLELVPLFADAIRRLDRAGI